MSCNGCRVLRKGCSENCSIRPCLQWIKSPQSQANATVFLAKFYGRAGLINLLNAGPDHLRPAIFRSLLYEACGRIVNPIYGSVGLLSTGTWHLCQAAVEAVLLGAPITPVASDAAAASQGPPLKVYDIRHVPSRDSGNNTASEHQPRRVRTRKRGGAVDKRTVGAGAGESVLGGGVESTSRESSLTHMSHEPAGESESVMSVEGTEPETSEAAKVEPSDGELELELTLGLEPVWGGRGGGKQDPRPIKKRRDEVVGKGAGWCDSDWVGPSGNMGLGSWLCEPRACEQSGI